MSTFDSGPEIARRVSLLLRSGDTQSIAEEMQGLFAAAHDGNPHAMAVAAEMLMPHIGSGLSQFNVLAKRHERVAAGILNGRFSPEVAPVALRLLCEAAGRLSPHPRV